MPRLKKPASEKLNDSINTPVTRGLKKRVLGIAQAKNVPLTKLTRGWIETAAQSEPVEPVAAK